MTNKTVNHAAKPDMAQPKDTVEKGIKVIVAPNRLSAVVAVPWPEEGRKPYTLEDVKTALHEKGVTFGIDDGAIEEIFKASTYDEKVVVARGKEPIPGHNAQLTYKFSKVQELKPKEDEEGRIDYRDINFVQNATANQVLVEKIPPTDGTPGTDVLGAPVSAKAGRDIRLPGGPNTKISDDGTKLLAGTDGAIVFAAGIVRINDVHTVGGDVCVQTGNIHHNGSLIIRGKVDSGFEVVAKGDIEVGKSVADAKIVSSGNIMVKGGFQGSHRGLLQSEGDVHTKYVDDQIIVAGNEVRIGGEVFNSNITARTRVVVYGPRGRIVGGRIMAGDEIKATILGSDAGARTELQVAYDPELMKRYYEIVTQRKNLDENAERVKEGLYAFYRLQMDNKLTPERQEALKKLEEFNRNLPKIKKELDEKKAALETEIQKNRRARIIAVKNIFPGVVLQFGIIYKEITDTMGPTIFHLEGSTIFREEYKPGKDDL